MKMKMTSHLFSPCSIIGRSRCRQVNLFGAFILSLTFLLFLLDHTQTVGAYGDSGPIDGQVENPYQNVFPFFDNTNAIDRNDLLLKSLRQRHSLLMFDDIVPKVITNSREGMLFMKDSPGRQFYWHSASNDVEQQKRKTAAAASKAIKAKETSTIAADRASRSKVATAQQVGGDLSSSSSSSSLSANSNSNSKNSNFDPAAGLLSDMVGVCLVYPNDYWNYQFCHRNEIRQFHTEHTEKGPVKTHDWSLGSFENSTILYGNGDIQYHSYKNTKSSSSEPKDGKGEDIVKVVDYYFGGQMCHETNRPRTTEVHIQCCHPSAASTYNNINNMIASHPPSPQSSPAASVVSRENAAPPLHTIPSRSIPSRLPGKLEAELVETRQQQQQQQQQQQRRRSSSKHQTNLGSSNDVEFSLPYDLRLVSEIDVCVYRMDVCNVNLCKNMNINMDINMNNNNKNINNNNNNKNINKNNNNGQSGSQSNFYSHTGDQGPIGGADVRNIHEEVYQQLVAPSDTSSSSSSGRNGGSGARVAVDVNKDISEYEMLSAILHHFSSACMYRNLNYWNYEICINTHILQYHAGLDANHKPFIDSQFLLGNATAKNILSEEFIQRAVTGRPESSGNDGRKSSGRIEPDLAGVMSKLEFGMPLNSMVEKEGSQLLSINLEFEGGTPCDLVNMNRSSTVQLACGAKDMIVDIIEDRTCHYLFKVHMQALCKVPGFAPSRRVYKEVEMRFDPTFRPGMMPNTGEEDIDDIIEGSNSNSNSNSDQDVVYAHSDLSSTVDANNNFKIDMQYDMDIDGQSTTGKAEKQGATILHIDPSRFSSKEELEKYITDELSRLQQNGGGLEFSKEMIASLVEKLEEEMRKGGKVKGGVKEEVDEESGDSDENNDLVESNLL